jgi:membrane-associated phospholipid phosphatase
VRGRHWKPVLLFFVILGGLLMVDPHDPGYFRHTRTFREFNRIVSGENAAAAMWIVVIGTFGIGLVASDKYLRNTALCSGAAVLNSEFITQIMKGLDRRLRPQDVMSYHHLLDSWFKDRGGTWYSGPGSFPSGHMIAAVSIATAFAIRYRHRPWVPWVAYGAAGTVGFSRITLLSHFPSDVFAGAVFGYAICRYVVLPRRDPKPVDETELDELAEARARS